jgi:hypothetical protein
VLGEVEGRVGRGPEVDGTSFGRELGIAVGVSEGSGASEGVTSAVAVGSGADRVV